MSEEEFIGHLVDAAADPQQTMRKFKAFPRSFFNFTIDMLDMELPQDRVDPSLIPLKAPKRIFRFKQEEEQVKKKKIKKLKFIYRSFTVLRCAPLFLLVRHFPFPSSPQISAVTRGSSKKKQQPKSDRPASLPAFPLPPSLALFFL